MVFFHFGAKAKKNFIQEANRRSKLKGTTGTFGKWCKSQGLAKDGKVTLRCIKKAKSSGNTTLIRRATFAKNIGGYKGAVHTRSTRRSRFGNYRDEESDYKGSLRRYKSYKDMLMNDSIAQEEVNDFHEENVKPLRTKIKNHTYPRTYANAIISRRVNPELAMILANHRRQNKLRFGKSKTKSNNAHYKKYTPGGGRKSPGVSANSFPIGTVRKGLDNNNWVIKVVSNGTKRWVKMSSFGKRKSNNAHYKKYTPGGGRKSPGVSANSFPIGTVRTGLDGGNWVIKVVSNGTKRWVKMSSFGKRKRTLRFGNKFKQFDEEEYVPFLNLNKDLNYAEKVLEKIPDNDPKKQKAETLIQKIKQKIKQIFTLRNAARLGKNVLEILNWLTQLIMLITSLQNGYAGLYAASSVFRGVTKPLNKVFTKLSDDKDDINDGMAKHYKDFGFTKFKDEDKKDIFVNKNGEYYKYDQGTSRYIYKGSFFNKNAFKYEPDDEDDLT
jgi:hypothetical protein